jgi:uncharacterized membrane-anchored protein YitT (DUF2179 family)
MKKQAFSFRREAFRILLCTAASIVISLVINTFVHTGGLLPGGLSGLSLLLIHILKDTAGISLSYGIVYIILNAFPVIISFRLIGKKFTIYSCYTIIMVSILTSILPSYVITYDILLIAIFGGIVNGFGTSLCLFARATSGGMDFVSIYVSEKFHIDGWNVVLAFNAAVLTIDGFLYGWDKALYSIIFQYATIQIISLLNKRYKKNTLFIITMHPIEIAALISQVTGHGATEIMAVGSYENQPRTLVYSVVGSDDLHKLNRRIPEVDPEAFVNVIRTEQLNGRFALPPND